MGTPADVPLARTVYRIASSGRMDLCRQTIKERRAWPAPMPAPPDIAAHAEITSAARAMLRWVERGQEFWACGGIPASYNARKRRYDGPYPETTGYSIPTLIELGSRAGFREADLMARKAADWLVSRQSNAGDIRCNIETPPTGDGGADQIVLFDCGAILQGFTAMARRADAYADPTERLARFLVDAQRADGLWDSYLAFEHFGSHNALVAYALIDAGSTLNAPHFTEAGHRCLNALRGRLHKNGYIEGCEFPGVRQGVAFLHPFVYTIEGYLKAAALAPDRGYFDAVRPALDALRDGIARTGQIPGAFVQPDMSTSCSFTALTAIAQLADVGFRADQLSGENSYTDMSRQLMRFLRQVLDKTLTDAAWQGGLPSAYPIDAEYLPFCVNNWGAKYFLDASMGELNALQPVLSSTPIPQRAAIPQGVT